MWLCFFLLCSTACHRAETDVEKGDRLLTLEAMKVLMYVNSPLTAAVKEVLVGPRDHIDGGDLLIVFE